MSGRTTPRFGKDVERYRTPNTYGSGGGGAFVDRPPRSSPATEPLEDDSFGGPMDLSFTRGSLIQPPPALKRIKMIDEDDEDDEEPVRRIPVCSLQSMAPTTNSRRFERKRRTVEDRFDDRGHGQNHNEDYHGQGHDYYQDDFGNDNYGPYHEDDEPSSELSGSDNHATDVRNNESSNSATRATQSMRIAVGIENRMDQEQRQKSLQKKIVSTKEKVIAIGSRLVLYSICRGMCASY